MAAYTSTQAGNWSSPSTWGGAGVPTIGDTASIGHVVTVDTNTTVGTSPDNTTTFVITVTNNGQILIPTGITLTVRGNVILNPTSVIGVNLQINGSGRLYFDGAPVGSSRRYILQCVARARVRLNGTDDANRATIESNPASGVWHFSLTGSAPNLDVWSFARVNRAGSATTLFANEFGVAPTPVFAGAGQSISWTNVILNDCGRMAFTASDPNSLTLTNVVNNSAFIARQDLGGNESQGVHINCAAGSGVVANINNCVFDTAVLFQGSQFMSVHNCYFGYEIRNSIGNTAFASSSNLFIAKRYFQARTWYGSLRGCYWFNYFADNLNYFITAFIPNSSADEVTDMVLDAGNTSPQEPDGLAIFNLPTGTHYSFNRIFYLPDSAGVSSGAWFNVYPDPSNLGTCSFDHNTIVSARGSGGENCLKFGEKPDRTGMITSYRSNLIWTPPTKVGGMKIERHILSNNQDVVSAANANFNWGWNLAAGADGNGYNRAIGTPSLFSTGTPDVNGGNGNPQFVDTTRNLIRFDITFLGNSVATAWADATAYAVGDVRSASDPNYFGGETINWRCILAHTSASGNATNGKPGSVSGFRTNWEPMSMFRLRENTARIAELSSWVRAGYAVTNSALLAGHDGVTIGAGEYNGPIQRTPNVINLTTSLFAPVVAVTQNLIATPTAASLTISTFEPSVTATENQTATPTTATLSLSTFSPSVTVSDANTITPQTATLTLTTFTPTVMVASGSVTVTPATATLPLTTFAPTLSAIAPIWTITFSGNEACRGELTAIKTTGDLVVRQLTPV